MGIFYLGPSGTFSETATQAMGQALALDCADMDKLAPCATINAVVEATATASDWGVVPYYNLIDGLVAESLDRALSTGLRIHGALQLPIEIALGAAAGADDNAPIYSHAKALAQCAHYLDEHHSQRTRIAVTSTAQGADDAVTHGALALGHASLLAKRHLRVINPDATNRYFGRTNYTEFLLLGNAGKTPPPGPVANRCVIACAPQTDRPGLLADILGLLSLFQLNLARLHSRPAIAAAPTQLDPQVFYLEIAGAPDPDVLALCAASLARTLGGEDKRQVLFDLGSYPLVGLNGT